MNQILYLVPSQNLDFCFFDTGPLLADIRATWATFTLKGVLIPVGMPEAFQTKCEICFGGLRMILDGY